MDLDYRMEKYEKDIDRWERMEKTQNLDHQRIQTLTEKYNTGKKNKGGAAFNVITLDYEGGNDGKYLKQRDDEAKCRAVQRSQNIDQRANSNFNILTGKNRRK